MKKHNKLLKSLLAIVIAILMVGSVIPTVAFAAEKDSIASNVSGYFSSLTDFLQKIKDFFQQLIDFFKNLFNCKDDTDEPPVDEPTPEPEPVVDIWDGTVDSAWYDETATEFTIQTAEELAGFGELARSGITFEEKVINLVNDIDLAWGEWSPMNFYGTFNGNNHTIKNITYIPSSSGRMGFFQLIRGGTVRDLILDGIKGDVPVDGRFGGFARYLDSNVENIHVKNIEITTTVADVGGFIAYHNSGVIENCSVTNFTVNNKEGAFVAGFVANSYGSHTYNNCDVDGFKVISETTSVWGQIGGFTSQTNTGWAKTTLTDCDITGIDVKAIGYAFVGGHVAVPGAHTILTNCTAEGKIDAVDVLDGCAGGFLGDLGWNHDLGYMGHVVTDCTADVDITTKVVPAGGFVGSATNYYNYSMYATFNSCTAKGDITVVDGGEAPVGGFAGDADRGVYNNCKAEGKVTGTTYAGGFIGHIIDTNVKYDSRYPAGTRNYLVDQITINTCTGSTEVIGAEGKTGNLVGFTDTNTSVTILPL